MPASSPAISVIASGQSAGMTRMSNGMAAKRNHAPGMWRGGLRARASGPAPRLPDQRPPAPIPADDQRDDQDHQKQPHPPARVVAPVGAVGPRRQKPDEQEDQQNDQHEVER